MNTKQLHHVSTSIGTIGPLQVQVRQLLACATPSRNDRSAAIAFSHAGLPRPGRDLSCRHFVVPGEFPLLVLAAVHHDTCFHFALNLKDNDARRAFSAAYGLWGLDLVLVDPADGACSHSLKLDEEEHGEIRDTLRAYEGQPYVESALWLLRLGELASKVPSEFEAIAPQSTACVRHSILFLLGDSDLHTAALRAALKCTSFMRS